MNRSDLVIHLSNISGLTLRQTEVAVDRIISDMSNALAAGERIEIRGFGSFDLCVRLERMARNPRTGETFPIESRYFPAFRAGKYLRQALLNNSHTTQKNTVKTSTISLQKKQISPQIPSRDIKTSITV